MIYHYKGCNQIPGTTKQDEPFELPKYGPSTTDPTYYEPTATRIANMKRSAGAFQGLYDFTEQIDFKGKSKEEIYKAAVERAERETSSGVVDVRFSKHGMTHEEVSQVLMEKSLKADSMLKDKNQELKDNTKQLKKELKTAELVAEKLSSKEVDDTSTSDE